jgi:membrane associated rhomboid family serine protease/Zn-finger nucleic acid-binding protein
MGSAATSLIKSAGKLQNNQHCPNCGSILAQSILHGRTTQLCPRGHGRAYSASTLRAWIVDDYQVDFGLTLEKNKKGRRCCPRCNKQFLLSRFYQLPIEHCSGCSLVWLTDALLERMPLKPECDREHSGSSVPIPLTLRLRPGVEAVDDIYSPFEGVRRGKETPWATLALVLAFAAFSYAFWYLGEPGYFVALPREPFRYFGLPLLLATFTHTDWPHLFGNAYFLLMAGTVVESHLGWRRFLALFVVCAVGARIAHALNTGVGSLGASGAISGIVIALVATQPKAFYSYRPLGSVLSTPLLGDLFTVSLRVPIWLWAFAWFGFDLFLMSLESWYHDGVGHAAHLGGAVLGALLASHPFFQGPELAPPVRQKSRSKLS